MCQMTLSVSHCDIVTHCHYGTLIFAVTKCDIVTLSVLKAESVEHSLSEAFTLFCGEKRNVLEEDSKKKLCCFLCVLLKCSVPLVNTNIHFAGY